MSQPIETVANEASMCIYIYIYIYEIITRCVTWVHAPLPVLAIL